MSDLRARKLSAEAELLEMDRRKRAGELVERAAIERAAEARGVSRKIDRRAQGSDRGRYPPARDCSTGGWPRGGARPRGVGEIWIFRMGAVAQF